MQHLASFSLLALLAVSCSQAPKPVGSSGSQTAQSPQSDDPHGSDPHDHGAHGSEDAMKANEEARAQASQPRTPPAPGQSGLNFAAQEGWVSETPANGMRHRQFKLPKVDADAEDGELVVFYFQGGGGTASMNIDRWCGMFAQDDGSSSREAATITEESRDGMKLTHVDLTGRYVAEANPGEGDRYNKPEMRMLASVVECDGGPFFIKAVGPKATMDRWEGSYQAFLAGLK